VFTFFENHLKEHTTLQEWIDWCKLNVESMREEVDYLVFQLEVTPETGREHIQGAICMKKKKRATTLGGLMKVLPEGFQVMRGKPKDSQKYCTKAETRKPGTEPFEWGMPPGGQGQRKDLECVADEIKKNGARSAADAFPTYYMRYHKGMHALDNHYKKRRIEARVSRPVKVIVAWGESGAGKSWWAENFDQRTETYQVPIPKQGDRLNMDGYDGERTILIQDYRGEIDLGTFKRLLDIYNTQFNTKGDMIQANWNYVLITSNFHPNTWYTNDVDAWGTEALSPIQRRIDEIVRFTGNYARGNAVVHFDKQRDDGTWITCHPNELPDREYMEGNGQEPDNPATPESAEIAEGAALEELEQETERAETFLQDLEQEWEEEDLRRQEDWELQLDCLQAGVGRWMYEDLEAEED
jgi:hypothetical protein